MATQTYRPGSREEAARTADDVDRDSLHILPLSILPLETPGLKRARMIKNAQLNSVVELFHGAKTGSGQLDVEDVPKEFGWQWSAGHPDLAVLRKVAELPSYDVYSLRISLRSLDIQVEDYEQLKLSPHMSRELAPYMRDFTRPLMLQIYGDDDLDIATFEDVVRLFRHPDRHKALEKLKQMADALGIEPADVPAFIEDYGDVFLALSYYRRCLAALDPTIRDFRASAAELRHSLQLRQDTELMRTLDHVEEVLIDRLKGVRQQMDEFDTGTENMWNDISAAHFQALRARISEHHLDLGAVLCALTVKMDAWAERFPDPFTGGPRKRAEFIMTQLRQGIDRIQRVATGAKPADGSTSADEVQWT